MPLDVGSVLQLSWELQRASTVGDLVRALRDALARSTSFREGWLAAIEPGAPRMVRILAFSGGASEVVLSRAPRFPVDGDRMLEEICARREPVVVVDARTDPRTDKEMVARLGNRTIVNVPMLLGDELLGAVGIGSFAPEEPHAPTEAELELMAVYASLLAAAFQRVRLVDAQRELQRQLQAAQRLEALAVLTGGIAHDFNNLVTAILNGIAFVAEGPLGEAQRDDLERVDEAARRASDLTRQLLAMGRRQPLRRAPQDPGERVRAVAQLFRRLIPPNIAVQLDVPERLPCVLGDAAQIDQVLMNLCLNARDAMPAGGRLALSAREVEVMPDSAAHPRPRPGRHVAITVEDSGQGMPPEVLEHVLEPFFTTKAPGKGTGLGLAVAAGIVEQHGGFISCDSEVGRGTQFQVFFPVAAAGASPGLPEGVGWAQAGATSAAGPQGGPAVRGGTERILVAEDESAVCGVMVRVLAGAGYQVTAVPDGLAAVEAAGQRPFDLVVLDAVMPGASGRTAWERIRAARPEARFLLVSGHASDVFPPELREVARLPLLAKPFTAAGLLGAVRGALDAC